jgi:hypothetical protein
MYRTATAIRGGRQGGDVGPLSDFHITRRSVGSALTPGSHWFFFSSFTDVAQQATSAFRGTRISPQPPHLIHRQSLPTAR